MPIDANTPSEAARSAIAYLDEMGGTELADFPEAWAWVHDGPGSVAVPVSVSRSTDSDGGLVAVSFFEVRKVAGGYSSFPAEGGDERVAGVAVVHDSYRPARAFVFGNPADFDNAVTDSDIRGMMGER